jgi:hypothetical protein
MASSDSDAIVGTIMIPMTIPADSGLKKSTCVPKTARRTGVIAVSAK